MRVGDGGLKDQAQRYLTHSSVFRDPSSTFSDFNGLVTDHIAYEVACGQRKGH